MGLYSSGSEALDTAHAQDLLTRLCVISEVPNTGMSAARRARRWTQIAELSAQVSEVAAGLARELAPERDGGSGAR
jgi:hypothetical protein